MRDPGCANSAEQEHIAAVRVCAPKQRHAGACRPSWAAEKQQIPKHFIVEHEGHVSLRSSKAVGGDSDQKSGTKVHPLPNDLM